MPVEWGALADVCGLHPTPLAAAPPLPLPPTGPSQPRCKKKSKALIAAIAGVGKAGGGIQRLLRLLVRAELVTPAGDSSRQAGKALMKLRKDSECDLEYNDK